MKKNGFLLFLIVSLALTAFLAGYIMVKRGADTTAQSKTGTILDKFSGQETSGKGQEEIVHETAPIPLTERRVLSMTSSYNKGSVLYFEKGTGKLYELNLESKTEQPVLDKMPANFISAAWSPTKKAFIGSFVSGSRTVLTYFNIDTGKEVSLAPDIRSAAFSPDGNLIAYHYLESTASRSTSGKIVLSEPDGKYEKKILDTRLDRIKMSWPTKEKIALETSASEIFLLSEDGKLSNLLGPGFGLENRWSPSGKKIIFSFFVEGSDQKDTVLNLKDLESKEEKQIANTSASKCVWSIDDINIFCAIQKTPSVDDVYVINTVDGSQKLIAEPLMQIKEMMLSSLEDQLLFINTADEKLYSIKISD